MRCFAMAKQHFQYAHVNHKGSMGNDGETTLEKGICMPVGFLHEKGVYIMLGRRVPNLLVLTSLKRPGFPNMVVFTERRATRFQNYWFLHHFEQKVQYDGVKV